MRHFVERSSSTFDSEVGKAESWVLVLASGRETKTRSNELSCYQSDPFKGVSKVEDWARCDFVFSDTWNSRILHTKCSYYPAFLGCFGGFELRRSKNTVCLLSRVEVYLVRI